LNRLDFQNLSRIRLRDARVLLTNGKYEGSYYLAGYAIECALKACIAKKVKRYDFPDKEFTYNSYTHNLEKLIIIAGLDTQLNTLKASNRTFEINWTIVKDWSEQVRYTSFISNVRARDLYSAITSRNNGIMAWLRTQW
jgi:hypothetical protein